jgi:hypothetical protein
MAETLKNGRYVLVGVLGEGAQGQTLDGIDTREDRPVAIKRFDVRGARGWKDVELAEREARVLQSLAHPLLPRYVEHFEENGALYLVMERIEGEPLSSLKKRGGKFGVADARRFLAAAGAALDYLHGRTPPVIHRDLKPGNVIRRPDGTFAFVDFGAVRERLKPEGGSTVVGTFGYMAPEQFQGRAQPSSDVYAIGATVLAMLTGREPETMPHRGLAIDVRATLAPVGLGARDPLVRILEQMLEPDPDRRPARIAPLLEAAGSGVASSAKRKSAPAAAARSRDAFRKDVDRLRAETAAEAFRRALEQEAWTTGTREARRAARRARRAAQRAMRHGMHRHERHGPPPRLMVLFITVAILAVTLATQIVVPWVLVMLARVMRIPVLQAAAAVRAAGAEGVEDLKRSRAWFQAQAGEKQVGASQARVAPAATSGEHARVRVEDAVGSADAAARGEADDDAHAVGGRAFKA